MWLYNLHNLRRCSRGTVSAHRFHIEQPLEVAKMNMDNDAVDSNRMRAGG